MGTYFRNQTACAYYCWNTLVSLTGVGGDARISADGSGERNKINESWRIMQYDKLNRTFSCSPTLTDSEVLEFCRNGFLILNGVVPSEINQRTCDYLNGKTPSNPSYIPEGYTEYTKEDLENIRNSPEPTTLILEDWFINQVLLNSQLSGALRSLLGHNVGLPNLLSRHTTQCPEPAQGWHHDADSVFGPETNYLEVFYYPQATPVEMGPTEVLPGSHIKFTHREDEENPQ